MQADTSSRSPFQAVLLNNYLSVKQDNPGEGRRKWLLRVVDSFWRLSAADKLALADFTPAPHGTAVPLYGDVDPLDHLAAHAPGLGILLRADYSNEAAWQTFSENLQAAEIEFATSGDDNEADEGGSATGGRTGSTSGPAEDELAKDGDEDDDMDSESSSDSDAAEAAPIFTVVDGSADNERALLSGISNLTALRLFNDVSVRSAPAPPQGTKRLSPSQYNRLVDRDGWQEIYLGKTLWIYDGRSNVDQCVRLVSPQGDLYGTATGDSWRARVSHICELQVNMSTGAMKIDFGGLDRWDHHERQRNLTEAEGP